MFFATSILIVLLALLFTLWPTRLGAGRRSLALSQSDTPLGRLKLRKEILLDNISDLDFEYAMGKLAKEDHEEMRGILKRQAAQVMEQMDVLSAGRVLPEGDEDRQAARFCAACGGKLPGTARFCPSCGEQVTT